MGTFQQIFSRVLMYATLIFLGGLSITIFIRSLQKSFNKEKSANRSFTTYTTVLDKRIQRYTTDTDDTDEDCVNEFYIYYVTFSGKGPDYYNQSDSEITYNDITPVGRPDKIPMVTTKTFYNPNTETISPDVFELVVTEKMYNFLAKGDQGRLTFKDSKVVSFKRGFDI